MSRILVIDDDADARELFGLMLTRARHEVLFAADGSQGIALYRAEHPDAVIVDIFMPGKDGLQVIRELRREFTEARIIAVSAGLQLGGAGLVNLAQDVGADATLRKPVDHHALVQAVARVLAKSD